jgi:hypothetical protein
LQWIPATRRAGSRWSFPCPYRSLFRLQALAPD